MNKLDRKYHFNYPKHDQTQLYQRLADKYEQIALADPDDSVSIEYDDILSIIRLPRRRGLSTVEVHKVFETIMKLHGKSLIRVDERSISSHLSRAYNEGILDTVEIPGRNDERYKFPEGVELDGTATKATRLDRWNVGIQRRKERANISKAGADKRLTELSAEDDEFARALNSQIV